MSDERWFRLLVQAIGILLLGMAAPMVLWYLGAILNDYRTTEASAATYNLWVRIPPVLAYGVQASFGIYLIRGGGALSRWCLRRSLP